MSWNDWEPPYDNRGFGKPGIGRAVWRGIALGLVLTAALVLLFFG